WPASVHRLPLTTLVVIPAVDGRSSMGSEAGSRLVSGVTGTKSNIRCPGAANDYYCGSNEGSRVPNHKRFGTRRHRQGQRLPPILPPFFIGEWSSGLPRPEPLFLPP